MSGFRSASSTCNMTWPCIITVARYRHPLMQVSKTRKSTCLDAQLFL